MSGPSRQLLRTCGPTRLPVGWYHLGNDAADFDLNTWELERVHLAMESTSTWARSLRVGARLALCFDVFDAGRHDRVWLPSTRLVAQGWEFAVYPDREGQRVYLFTHVPAPA